MADEKNEKSLINQPILDFVEELKKNFAAEQKREKEIQAEQEEQRGKEMEDTGESMTRLYEKVRNMIEYKDDHLIKRYAIERILRRNLIIEFRRENFSGQFIDELILAGYLDHKKISDDLRSKVAAEISKYQKAVRLTGNFESKKWLVSIGACEIEELLFPNPSRYALARAMYLTVRDRIKFSGRIPEKEKDIQIFISVLKTLSKVDNATLNYSLAKIYQPEWFDKNLPESEKLKKLKNLTALSRSLRREIANPISVKLGVALRKYAVFFNILYEAALANLSKIEKVFANPESLKFAGQLAAGEVYDREMKRFWKRVKRSLIFLIITKVLLALVVEYPFDLYIEGVVALTPIFINLIFPPFYLLLLSMTVKKPSETNTSLISQGIEEVVYSKEAKEIAEIRMRDIETFSDASMNLFFLLTFGISFGIAVWVLIMLHFNWMGILIFLFLFSVVSFFNSLVRQPMRELLIAREKEGLLGVIIDTLSIPFVRIGKWMSVNFSRVNVLMFLFDVVIEAPFKVVVRFIQEWAGFIRQKKDEMI